MIMYWFKQISQIIADKTSIIEYAKIFTICLPARRLGEGRRETDHDSHYIAVQL